MLGIPASEERGGICTNTQATRWVVYGKSTSLGLLAACRVEVDVLRYSLRLGTSRHGTDATSAGTLSMHEPDEDNVPVTLLFRRAESGDDEAIADLFNFYFDRLAGFGGLLLSPNSQRVLDGEDLAQSVFARFLRDAEAGFRDKDGRLIKLENRNQVWAMLAYRLEKRALNRHRFLTAKKRGEGRVAGESAFRTAEGDWDPNGIGQIGDDEFSDLLVDDSEKLHKNLLEILAKDGDPLLYQIGMLILAEESPKEISKCLSISISSVYRKIKLIKECWVQSF